MIPMIQLPIHKQHVKQVLKFTRPPQFIQRPEVIVIEDSDSDPNEGPQKPTPNSLQTNVPPQQFNSALVMYRIDDFSLLEIPTIRLTTELLKDPYRLIDDLYSKHYDKVGIVKLVVPALSENVWKNLQGRLGEKRLVTRRQSLNRLKEGKPFTPNQSGYSLNEYCAMANRFQNNYRPQVGAQTMDPLRQAELEFWSLVDNPTAYSPVEVEYAADLLVCKYASAFSDGEDSFNLNRVNKMKDAMFQVLTTSLEMSGISVPWLYLGMKFANFCWHCEDLFLSSLNYMHAGAPKTWYAIPPSSAERFNEVFAQKHDLKSNPRLLYDITTMISPIELQRNGVKVLRTDQHPGELILTLGGTYHAGFSHGLNCSEAVNIAPTQWMSEHPKAVEQYRRHGNSRKVSFPLEWLVIKVIKNMKESQFSKPHVDQILQQFIKIRETEIQFRETVIKLYPKIDLFVFKNPDERYDKHTCKICQDYMYLSYLYCNKQTLYFENKFIKMSEQGMPPPPEYLHLPLTKNEHLLALH